MRDIQTTCKLSPTLSVEAETLGLEARAAVAESGAPVFSVALVITGRARRVDLSELVVESSA